MTDITNKTLAVFLLVAMVVSLSGIIVTVNELDSVTGRAATDTGTSNFSIESTISVVFTTDNANFGTGSVNQSGSHSCTLNTSGAGDNGIPNVDCTGFNDHVPALVIQNQGTLNVTLNMTFDQIASAFIGGSAPAAPSLTYLASNNESGSCASGDLNSAITEVPDSTNQSICDDTMFDWQSGSRTLNIDIGMDIPQDAAPGVRTLTIIAFASNP